MKGWDNGLYVLLLINSNMVAILQLIAAIKWLRIARLSFFFLFAWASWKTSWKKNQIAQGIITKCEEKRTPIFSGGSLYSYLPQHNVELFQVAEE